jgi:hypothetical protein
LAWEGLRKTLKGGTYGGAYEAQSRIEQPRKIGSAVMSGSVVDVDWPSVAQPIRRCQGEMSGGGPVTTRLEIRSAGMMRPANPGARLSGRWCVDSLRVACPNVRWRGCTRLRAAEVALGAGFCCVGGARVGRPRHGSVWMTSKQGWSDGARSPPQLPAASTPRSLNH